MAAQTATLTAASPSASAITLAADTTCVHISGNLGAGVFLTVSPDGSLPYVPVSSMLDIGRYGSTPSCHALALKAGWRLKAEAHSPYGALNATVAVE